MGIYINGVEMPTGNDELRLIIHSNGQVIISHQTYYEEAEAVPVPPHGKPMARGNWEHGVCQTCFFDWSKIAPLASVPNFCPNCGALMEDRKE